MRVIRRQRLSWCSLSTTFAILLAGCNGDSRNNADHAAAVTAGSRAIVLITVDGWWDPSSKSDSIPSVFVANEVRLEDAMTPSPQLRPAMSALLSGTSPVENGIRNDVTTPMPPSVPYVTQALTERGWRTAAFVADPRVGVGSGLERGFEVFDPPKEVLFGSFRQIPHARTPDDVVSDFSTWLSSVPDSASLFAWVQISRPLAGKEKDAKGGDLTAALDRLSKLLRETERLKGASVALVGTAGKLDPDDGMRSGYFLNADVLSVPVILRPGAGSQQKVDPARPFSLTELTRWITGEAGVEPSSGATGTQAPRLAWTWRGRDEFGWPAEIAAHQGTALCVRSVPGSQDRCESWSAARDVIESDRNACVSVLDRQTNAWADPGPRRALPAELTARLAALGLQPRPPATATRRLPSLDVRARVVPIVLAARRIEDPKKAAEADAAYGRALALDPENFGVMIEAGESLALANRPKLAAAKLEPALRAAPSNPEAWHWLGHVAYLSSQLARADARWRVAEALRPGNADVLYDLACSSSLLGNVSDADAYLRRAWAAGFKSVNKIQVDPDLRTLRADPAFLRFMREVVH